MAKRPRKVFPNETFPNIKVHSVICGTMHTLVLSNLGKVFSWGNNDDLALGRSGTDNLPGEVQIPIPINKIAAGDSHSLAYSTDLNKVYLWGSYRNSNGKFGERVAEPREINKKYWKGNIEKIICGSNHTLMLAGGKVYSWGNSEFGQIAR